MEVHALGPQRRGDSRLLRRIRAHQSWYRLEALGLSSWGATAPPNVSEYGSILATEAAAEGANFTSTVAFEAYKLRRKGGWGVEPYRCERYLTSSQTLTINFFAPLAADLPWLSRFLDALGLAAGGAAQALELEYQPAFRRAEHLDRTLADAFVQTSTGGVVFETKLADQFSRRWSTVVGNPFYEQVNRELQLWNSPRSTFDTTAKDQLARVHALGALAAGAPPPIVVIHHPLDDVGALNAEGYREVLQDPSLLTVMDLASALQRMGETATTKPQREMVQDLRRRYTAHELSEEAFGALESLRLRRRPHVPVAAP
ncbi:hypothetical protein [Frigoribacterium sp. VKM Ac-2530]|uniref:PGN_0703 family putative restriction endonuclease n=1 Tax=Frigoribacterium sp. VKM Ac-2530 TaxID=2783822 RepID=UPI00351C7B76